jgi:hypothetical protein
VQFARLREIERVLCPGGIAMLTVMGEELAAWKLPPDQWFNAKAIVTSAYSPADCTACRISTRMPTNQPKIADSIRSSLLRVSGWSFQHRAGSVALEISLDGRNVAACLANDPSPALSKVYPPAAGQKRGFTALVPLDYLRTGPHVVKCRGQGTTLPYLSTYFFLL